MAIFDNLICHWKLDESSTGSSAVTRQDSVTGRPLTDSGTVASATGKLSNAANFSGSNFLSHVDHADLRPGTGSFSISCWIYITGGTGTSRTILSKYVGNATDSEFLVRVTTLETIQFTLRNNASQVFATLASVALAQNTWYHVACTYNGTEARVYVNGSANTAASSYTAGCYTSTTAFCVGQRGNSAERFIGLIDSVSWFKRSLSAAEVDVLYNAGAGNEYPFRIPSMAAGNWSTAGTWRGGLIPGDGDLIDVAHTVTVESDKTIGKSLTAGVAANAAISVKSGGTVLIASTKVLTCKGDFLCFPSQATRSLDMLSGSKLRFDASSSASPSTTKYKLSLPASYAGAQPLARVRGTSVSRCEIATVGSGANAYIDGDGANYSGLIDAEFCDFTRLGDATQKALSPYPGSDNSDTNASLFRLLNCVFDTCGQVGLETFNLGAYAKYSVQNCTWKNSASAYCFGVIAYSSKLGAQSLRTLSGNVFDKPVHLNAPRGFVITGNYFNEGWSATNPDADGWAQFEGNFIRLTSTVSNLPMPGATVKDCFFFADNGGLSTWTEPIFIKQGEYSFLNSYTVDGCIFEFFGQNAQGSCISLRPNSVASVVTIKNCLVLPNFSNNSSGVLISAEGGSNMTFSVNKNTVFAGSQAAVRVGRTYAGHAGMLSSFKSNLIFDTTPSRGYKIYDDLTNDNVPDLVTSGNADYNGGFNLLAGSSTKGYNNLEFSGGAPGGHDVAGDPDFIDATRDLAAWDLSLNGAGTVASALSELQKANTASFNSGYTISNLLSYVRGGFIPRNNIYRSAAHDGSDIGALAMQAGQAVGSNRMMVGIGL